MNMVERKLGRSGTGSRMAMSFAGYGRRISGPAVGAIVTLRRRGGGHVGIVTGVTADRDPIVISGNHGNRSVGYAVREAVYPSSLVVAYTMPEAR